MDANRAAISFEFITDEDFRQCLENDYRELLLALENMAYKSAHILAGSIVEALLVDTLIASKSVPTEKALRMKLGTAIKEAQEHNIITEKTASLSAVIREYRNLIHPGRSVRLQEKPTEESAQVAKALVVMVAREIESWKQKHYGYTAKQIINKLTKDSSAIAIIPHLLAETRPAEIERLLLIDLPESFKYVHTSGEPLPHVEKAYIQCYRIAFERAPEVLKKQVMHRFVKMLKEESDSVILPYEIAFVRGHDLRYLPEPEAQLVADHLIGRMKEKVTVPLLEALDGIGPFLTQENVANFVEPLVKVIALHNDPDLSQLSRERLVSAWWGASSPVDHHLKKQLQRWIDVYQEEDWISVRVLEQILAEMAEIPPEDISLEDISLEDIPF